MRIILSNGLGTYEERFTRSFYDAIKGEVSESEDHFRRCRRNQRNYERNRTPDVIDDHYYYFNNVSEADRSGSLR